MRPALIGRSGSRTGASLVEDHGIALGRLSRTLKLHGHRMYQSSDNVEPTTAGEWWSCSVFLRRLQGSNRRVG